MNLASLIKRGSLRQSATATPATLATHGTFPPASTVATIATVAVAKSPDSAANDPARDSDRWCWPHSTAMTGAEIGTFTARLSGFTDKGLTLDGGEALADRLVIRDRDSDDRRLCLECLHLAGYGSWRCSNWQRSGIAIQAWDAQLLGELVRKLQRCDGFKGAQLGIAKINPVATDAERSTLARALGKQKRNW